MRTGIVVKVSPADQIRLEGVVTDRNSPQKHVWRARIILLTAEGHGTAEIMRRTGKAKTAGWRWQERFMQEGVDGLLRDKTRPSRVPALGLDVADRVVALTLTPPPGEVTHWTGRAMASVAKSSLSATQRIWRIQPKRGAGRDCLVGRRIRRIEHPDHDLLLVPAHDDRVAAGDGCRAEAWRAVSRRHKRCRADELRVLLAVEPKNNEALEAVAEGLDCQIAWKPDPHFAPNRDPSELGFGRFQNLDVGGWGALGKWPAGATAESLA